MKQRIFLTSKKVYLPMDVERLRGVPIADVLADKIAVALVHPCRVVDGDEMDFVPELGLGSFDFKVRSFGDIVEESGKRGFVLSVSRPGLVGMFYYRIGDDFMTEMANPDTQPVVEVVSGE